MLDITVLIVNYNTRKFLKNCLSSLYRNPPRFSWEILVIDNGSSDGSLDMLSELFPEVRIIHNHSNLGFAHANNQGAKNSKSRYLLLLNPDTILLNSVDGLVKFMDSNPECAVVGGRVISPDGTPQLTCRSFPSLGLLPFGRESPLTHFLPGNPWSRKFLCSELNSDRVNLVDAVGGVFMMVRRECFERVGGFDEDYFLYVEDIDLCYKIRKNGWKIYYVPNSSVIHFGGRSTQGVKIKTMMEHFKGMYRFFLKHHKLTWHKQMILFIELLFGLWIYNCYSSLKQLSR